MRTVPATVATLCALSAAAPSHAQQSLMVIQSATPGRVVLLSPTDGSVVDTDFITEVKGGPFDFRTPKDVLQVEDEIWVVDQLADLIFRFDLEGAFLSAIGPTGQDNMRGAEFTNGVVYVSNAGTANGAPGEAILMFGPDGAPMGSFPAGGPFDALAFNGELLVTNIDNDSLDRYSLAGAFLGAFHDSDGVAGIDFPQQANLKASNGNVIAAGFSAPIGLYEYDAATGAQVNFFAIGSGNRGIWELGNGNILFTDSGGINIYDVVNGTESLVLAGGSQYIGLLTLPETCAVDLNGDGMVTIADFLEFLNLFSAGDARAEFDGMPGITVGDFLAFLNAFSKGCP